MILPFSVFCLTWIYFFNPKADELKFVKEFRNYKALEDRIMKYKNILITQ